MYRVLQIRIQAQDQSEAHLNRANIHNHISRVAFNLEKVSEDGGRRPGSHLHVLFLSRTFIQHSILQWPSIMFFDFSNDFFPLLYFFRAK